MDITNEVAMFELPSDSVILRVHKDIYYYAGDVIRGRWYQGERELAKLEGSRQAYWIYSYLMDIAKVRIPMLEPILVPYPNYCVAYANNVIDGRFPEAESLIMKSSYSEDYIRRVIRGNWAYEGEEMWWILQTRYRRIS